MRILIVHDRQGAADQIEKVCRDALGAAAGVSIAKDYNSAREHLRSTLFDLMIIDLTIPVVHGSTEPGYEYAKILLEEVFNSEALNAPGDIIGITKDIDVLRLFDGSVGSRLMVVIDEDADGQWKEALTGKIAYVGKAVTARLLSATRQYDYDLLIVTAMDRELAPYREIFDVRPLRHFAGCNEFVFSDRAGQLRKAAIFSVGSSGQPSAASFTQALVMNFRPRLAIMSGYCGGVKGKVSLGDLMLFEATYAWDYGKWEQEGSPPSPIFRSRPNPIPVSTKVMDVFRLYEGSDFNRGPALLKEIERESGGRINSFKVHRSPAASGSAVVTDDSIVSRIRGLNDSIWAVDMESYGFYHAAKNTPVIKPEFLCVKSVSDYCNGEKEDGLHSSCSIISARLVENMITSEWHFI